MIRNIEITLGKEGMNPIRDKNKAFFYFFFNILDKGLRKTRFKMQLQ